MTKPAALTWCGVEERRSPFSETWTRSETVIVEKCTAYGFIQNVEGSIGSGALLESGLEAHIW